MNNLIWRKNTFSDSKFSFKSFKKQIIKCTFHFYKFLKKEIIKCTFFEQKNFKKFEVLSSLHKLWIRFDIIYIANGIQFQKKLVSFRIPMYSCMHICGHCESWTCVQSTLHLFKNISLNYYREFSLLKIKYKYWNLCWEY